MRERRKRLQHVDDPTAPISMSDVKEELCELWALEDAVREWNPTPAPLDGPAVKIVRAYNALWEKGSASYHCTTCNGTGEIDCGCPEDLYDEATGFCTRCANTGKLRCLMCEVNATILIKKREGKYFPPGFKWEDVKNEGDISEAYAEKVEEGLQAMEELKEREMEGLHGLRRFNNLFAQDPPPYPGEPEGIPAANHKAALSTRFPDGFPDEIPNQAEDKVLGKPFVLKKGQPRPLVVSEAEGRRLRRAMEMRKKRTDKPTEE